MHYTSHYSVSGNKPINKRKGTRKKRGNDVEKKHKVTNKQIKREKKSIHERTHKKKIYKTHTQLSNPADYKHINQTNPISGGNHIVPKQMTVIHFLRTPLSRHATVCVCVCACVCVCVRVYVTPCMYMCFYFIFHVYFFPAVFR